MRARLWNWKTLALLPFVLGAISCLGPILPLPQSAHAPHAWACANLACPAEANRIHGIVKGAKYHADIRLCECWIQDIRNLDIYTLVDPHKKAP